MRVISGKAMDRNYGLTDADIDYLSRCYAAVMNIPNDGARERLIPFLEACHNARFYLEKVVVEY